MQGQPFDQFVCCGQPHDRLNGDSDFLGWPADGQLIETRVADLSEPHLQ